MKAWHPAARIAVIVMLGTLGEINIWLDAKLEARSLPTLQVIITPVNLGTAAPLFRIG